MMENKHLTSLYDMDPTFLDWQREISGGSPTLFYHQTSGVQCQNTSEETQTCIAHWVHIYTYGWSPQSSLIYARAVTVEAQTDTQHAMQSCCWSQCWRHKARQSQHSSYQDRWLSKRPEVGQRQEPDTQLKEQWTRVSGQRHSLVLWHCSNVLGAFFTQWESGTWDQLDPTGICVDEKLESADDLVVISKCSCVLKSRFR